MMITHIILNTSSSIKIKHWNRSAVIAVFWFCGPLGLLQVILKKINSVGIYNNSCIKLQFSSKIKNTYKICMYNKYFQKIYRGLTLGHKLFFYIKSWRYKIIYFKNYIFLKLGCSHLLGYIIPPNIYINLKKKKKIFKLFSIHYTDICNLRYFFFKLKKPNIYTGSGIYIHNKNLQLKEGKKKWF